MPTKNLCCCASGLASHDCCAPYLIGSKPAETPLQLMRSRFSAFYLRQVDYLVNTLHPSQRESNTKSNLIASMESAKYLSLRIISHSEVGASDTQGQVEFVAFFTDFGMPSQSDTVHQLHEDSSFIKEEGHWLYLSGKILTPIKLGRNEACWCGSQKKLKKCHSTMSLKAK